MRFKKGTVVFLSVVLMAGFAGCWSNPEYDKPEAKSEGRKVKITIGMDQSDVLLALGAPNYQSTTVDTVHGTVERWQWGSPRAGMMVVILFQNAKVVAIHKE